MYSTVRTDASSGTMSHGCIPTGRVGNHAHDAAMNEPMLLFNAAPLRNMNLDFARRNDRNAGTDQLHGVLLVKACLDPGLNMRVERVCHDLRLLLEHLET